jgi:hypothetical protein
MSEAPIISGTCQLAKPTKAGMMAPKIMISPCIEMNWLKVAGLTSCSPGWKSSTRMTIASAPANRNMLSENHR